MSESPFPTRLVLRLMAIPLAFVIAGVVQSSKGGCSSGSSVPLGSTASAEDVTAARTKIQAMDKARRDALAKAKDTVDARPDLGACPVAFSPIAATKSAALRPEATDGYDLPRWDPKRTNDLLGNFRDEMAAIEGVGIAFADEVGDKPGPRSFWFESDARSESVQKSSIDRALNIDEAANDFELVIDHEIPGKASEGDKFEGGALIGRFYVWSYAKAQIVCAARIFATNSDHLSFSTDPGSSSDEKLAGLLRSDLREQALVQAKENLHRAGPPKAGDEDEPSGDGGVPARGRNEDAGAKSAPKKH